jgi:hypothetical protein
VYERINYDAPRLVGMTTPTWCICSCTPRYEAWGQPDVSAQMAGATGHHHGRHRRPPSGRLSRWLRGRMVIVTEPARAVNRIP